MSYEIRSFSSIEDQGLCLEAERFAFLDTGSPDESLHEKAQESFKGIKKRLIEGTYLGFTVVVDRTPVGLVFVDRDEDVAFVDNLYVVPDQRGKGLGTRLLTHTLDALKKEGAKTVELMVTADNESAIHLYEKLGFDVSRLRMKKGLASNT